MRKFELIAPCHFGLEAVLKKEIQIYYNVQNLYYDSMKEQLI